MHKQSCVLMLTVALILGAAVCSAAVPPRTTVGQTLEVPEADYERGQVYFLLPGDDTQFALTSEAPLKRTILTTSRAVGYLVGDFDPEESKDPVLGGGLRLPVATLSSGSSGTDRTLRGANYLNQEEHPEITFELTGTSDVERKESESEDVVAFSMQLAGQLTVRGTTREITMPAEVQFLLTNFSTFTRSVGDLVTVRGSFELDPTDFDWEMPRGAAALVAPSWTVDLFLLGSTLSPETRLNPNIDVERWLAERRYVTLARDLADAEGAASYGAEYLERYGDDAAALDSLARLILEHPDLRQRDLGLAQRLATRVKELDAENAEFAETRAQLATARGE